MRVRVAVRECVSLITKIKRKDKVSNGHSSCALAESYFLEAGLEFVVPLTVSQNLSNNHIR